MIPLVESPMEHDATGEASTFIVVEPVIDDELVEVAVMVALPTPTAVANPAGVMVTMVPAVSDVVQVAVTLLAVLPSSLTPVAVNC